MSETKTQGSPTFFPPEGYKTWLDYAIATMDTRSPYLENLLDGQAVSRGEMHEAARAELDALRKQAQEGETMKTITAKQSVDALLAELPKE